ncbi:GMC family oxidoreductase [Roseibaca sp. Y0-43]|uniref:GMC family oxidoreductase n=1 Tax=Roseibaca sp. Y0-43 TaxID=2816854 RepID=UPI001D0CB8F1|nr:GMC family oxidoreductase N-terminal domain-containing protein [Roseibaca sp. Y0-43]MCC1482278.1 GMC family oxidoreductase N-terminal domain-containing protein [Roseibaca sp. Y0-43]
MPEPDYSHIIIGGGTAGCVLAARLSAVATNAVLLLEAGQSDWHPYIHMPVGFAKMTGSGMTWGYRTEPQVHAGNRRIPYAQGRVLGGGSSVNAEVFTRGVPADYDRWAQQEGCDGWSFNDVQPYFLRSEGNTALADAWHGTDGPLGVSNIANPQPMTRAFVMACQQYGIPFNHDFNGATQAGAGYYQVNVVDGRRCSAARGYLAPVRHRKNLTVLTGAASRRLVFDGLRATGVEFRHRGKIRTVHAGCEVIVTAGAIGSPKLLMLSGIGPAEHLKSLGIKVLADIPGVGLNLSDHVNIDIVAELRGHESLDKYRKPHLAAWAGLQYALFRSGPVASNVVEGGLFWYSRPGLSIPDLQYHFLAGAAAEDGVAGVPPGRSGITLNCYGLRPKARGMVRLASADPAAAPLIDPNFMGHDEDLETTVQGLKTGLEILSQPALAKYIRRVVLPDAAIRSETELRDFVRQHCRTSYHPVGTCRMGSDAGSVVQTDLKLRGFEGIRICDSSVFPSLPGSNTNAPTAMLAEKASDLIAQG